MYFSASSGDKKSKDTDRVSLCRCDGADIALVSNHNLPKSDGGQTNYFEIEGDSYLAVANPKTSYVYGWSVSSSSFELVQEIATANAQAVEHYELDGAHYLAMANGGSGNSVVLRWNKGPKKFVEHQKLETIAARGFTHFAIKDVDYLAVANSGSDDNRWNVASVIYRWNPVMEILEQHHTVQTYGARHWEHFEIGGTNFLVVANERAKSTTYHVPSSVYKWDDCIGKPNYEVGLTTSTASTTTVTSTKSTTTGTTVTTITTTTTVTTSTSTGMRAYFLALRTMLSRIEQSFLFYFILFFQFD